MSQKIEDIKKEFESAYLDMQKNGTNINQIIEKYTSDTRAGVTKIISKYEKLQNSYNQELLRLENMKMYEHKYSEFNYICGIDEVGRGPLAGPVVAAAVILPKDCTILYLNDSKQVSAKKREEIYREISQKAIAIGVGVIPPAIIDEINILNATYEAMKIAINELKVSPDLLLNDAVRIPGIDNRQVPIIKGDEKSVSIAAASIFAKVTRDRMMEQYDIQFPEYGFASNKGYGSATHIEALKKYGSTLIHRQSFIKNFQVD